MIKPISLVFLLCSFSLVNEAVATSVKEVLSPESPSARGIHYQFRTRDTPRGKVARISAISQGEEFPSNASVSVAEVSKTKSSFSVENLITLSPRVEGNRLVAEFLITPALKKNAGAAFVLTLTGKPGAGEDSVARPWSDFFILPLPVFLKADSIIHPPMRKEWTLLNQSSSETAPKKWANFKNDKTGDALAFQSWKVGPSMKLESSPVLQSSIETFNSNGRAALSNDGPGLPVEDRVRHQILEIRIGDQMVEAIEFTCIYGSNPEEIESIGHGYIVLFDEVVYAVQHTSKRPISSDLALSMTCELLAKKFTVGSWGRGVAGMCDR